MFSLNLDLRDVMRNGLSVRYGFLVIYDFTYELVSGVSSAIKVRICIRIW